MLFPYLLLLHLAAAHASLLSEQHRITSLPGLPNLSNTNATHYSGYLNAQTAIAATRTFYYYVQHPDPAAPLLIWMNGGPGASSLMGLFTELGPLLLNSRSLPENNHGEWVLHANPYSWSNNASLLVWEQPAGVGFSKCDVVPCPEWNDTSSANANLRILQAFYHVHPTETSRPVTVAGESYGGVYVPLLAHNIHTSALPVQLNNIAVGNGCVGFGVAGGCGTDAMELLLTVLEQGAPGVSRIVLTEARTQCQGELDQGHAPKDLPHACFVAMQHVFQELGAYNMYSRGSSCGPNGNGNWGNGDGYSCGADVALKRYLRSAAVQQSLHAIPTEQKTPLPWQWWDGDSPGLYNISNPDIVTTYASLLRNGIGVTVYNGLRDTGVPAQGAARWISSIANGTVVSRRKWSALSVGGGRNQTIGEQVAGYVTEFTNKIKFVTIVGAGHLSPGERPISTFQMISAVLEDAPLPMYTGVECERLWLGRAWGEFC